MTQINPNINPNLYNNLPRGNAPQPVRIPNYYYVPDNFEPKSVKEVLEENPMYDMFLKPFIEHPVAVLGTWLGLGVGFDAYSKACGGKYETSLVGKAAKFGDSIQQSKLIQSKPAQSVIKGLGSIKSAGAKVVQNSALLRAMKNTPTMPEWSMVKSQMYNQKQEVVQDFIRINDALKLGSADAPKMKEIGLNSAEKNMLKKVFNVNNISKIPETNAVNQVLLHRLGRTPEQIKKIQALGGSEATAAVKREILKEMGLTTDKLKFIKEDVFGNSIDDVIKATQKVKGKVRMGAGHYGWMGPGTKLFERTIGCDEIYNKLHSMSGGAKTATGRFTSKLMQMIHRGLTFGGGKLGALIFIAPLLVEVGMNVKKADKDQKVGTIANGLMENISWVFTLPLALRMMHSLGGVKYAGMTKDQVENYRKALANFNNKAKAGEFKTKLEYNKAKTKIKDMLKVDKQNIFTKGIRKLGSFMTMDLETFKPYRSSNIAANGFRKLPNMFRNIAGIPMRFGIWGAISMGVLGAALTKCTTAIFGKSYDSMKQDERKEEKKKQKQFLKDDLNDRLYKTAQMKAASAATASTPKPQQNRQAYASRGINEYSSLTPQIQKEETTDNYTYIPSQENIIPSPIKPDKTDNYTYMPSQECTIKTENTDSSAKRRYIPSQAAVNIQKNFDNSGLQAALDRAQRAEDRALRVLAGNFDGI